MAGTLEDQTQAVETEEPQVEVQEEEETEEQVDFGFDFDSLEATGEEPKEQEEPEKPEESEPPQSEGEDELESLRAQNRFLQEQINKISEQAVFSQSQPLQPQQQGGPQPNFGQINFLEKHNYDDIMEDAGKFNEFMNEVVQQAMLRATEATMLSVPQLVTNYTREHLAMSNMVNGFYEENPDLKENRQLVAFVARQVAAENPELEAHAVFSETAKRAREVLGMKHQALTDTKSRPAFAQTKGRAREKAPKIAGMEKEIDEMLKLST